MNAAEIILQQMGGHRFKMMVGAYDVYSTDGGQALSMKFKGSKKANYLKVALNEATDTYTMEFGKLGRKDYKVVETKEGVYCDMLQNIFTSTTGLYTHL